MEKGLSKTAASNAQIDRDIIKIMLEHDGDSILKHMRKMIVTTMEFHYDNFRAQNLYCTRMRMKNKKKYKNCKKELDQERQV